MTARSNSRSSSSEHAPLLNHASSSSPSLPPSVSPSAPPVVDSGVPLEFVQLDDRFRVSRSHGIPLTILSVALAISDGVIIKQADDEILSHSRCSYLISLLSFHFLLIAILLFFLLLMLLRPIAHKAFPFLFALFSCLGAMSIPWGLSLLFFFPSCRHLSTSSAYWHSLLLAWFHCWPALTYFLLFRPTIRSWVRRGWRDGRVRGFLAPEKERAPFVSGSAAGSS